MSTRWTLGAWVVLALMAMPLCAAAADGCAEPERALGVERVVEIDAGNGPLFGDISLLAREPSFLAPKEVVLTFDDGPMPWITSSILDTLDRFCTKATFFSVGRMAIAYPATVKDVLARGHTLGGHTWSHPLNLKRRGLARATDEIERGFAAIAMAAGQPIAPFFRFPGLSDSDPMLAHLQDRGIAAFTVDVVSNDSYIGNPDRLTTYTLNQIESRQGGIVLFHDIKSATAKALPDILKTLKSRGYKVVHMRAKAPLQPRADYDEDLKKLLAKAGPASAAAAATVATDEVSRAHLVPFFGSPAVLKTLSGVDAEVAAIAPAARPRARAAAGAESDEAPDVAAVTTHRPKRARRVIAKRAKSVQAAPVSLFGF